MKALVTGARGFIGRHMARELARADHTVDGIGRGAFPDHAAWGVASWQASDLTREALPSTRYDVIVHCAGGSSVGASVADPHADFAQTVPGLAGLLEWMRTGPSKRARLVVPSSAAVYGACREQPILETAPLAPISPYGTYKLICEQLCRTYAAGYELSISVVRLFSIYGAGLERQLLWDACCKARDGRAVFSGTGRERRDWLHVTDACALLAAAAGHASPSMPIVNGGSGTGTHVVDALSAVFRELGLPTPPAFDGSSRAGDPTEYIADIGRATALGWAPIISLADGIAEYARWFRTRS